MSTQSPDPASGVKATLTSRRTPETSTRASPSSSCSTTWPGMPRHMCASVTEAPRGRHRQNALAPARETRRAIRRRYRCRTPGAARRLRGMADTLAADGLERSSTALRAPRLPGRRPARSRRRDRPRRARRAPPTCPPAGRTSRRPARYRLARRDDEALFGYAVGPHSWKQELLPSRVRLWQARRQNGGLAVEEEPRRERADRVRRRPALRARGDRDPGPRLPRGALRRPRLRRAARRRLPRRGRVRRRPSAPASAPRMGTGPGATEGFDLALTELLEGEHRFLVRAGSPAGAARARRAAARARDRATTSTRPAASSPAPPRGCGDRFDADGVHDLLLAHLEQPGLGRRRRALPQLHELHARLPDVLLHERRGRLRARRRDRRRASASGTRASPSATPRCTAATRARRRARATASG